jgi:hypothetical protein
VADTNVHKCILYSKDVASYSSRKREVLKHARIYIIYTMSLTGTHPGDTPFVIHYTNIVNNLGHFITLAIKSVQVNHDSITIFPYLPSNKKHQFCNNLISCVIYQITFVLTVVFLLLQTISVDI